MNYFGNNNQMVNQLLRQRDSIDGVLAQYMNPPQVPVQNIINTNSNMEFEARYLKEGERAENVMISRRTLFIDEKNEEILIKEIDGSISKTYKIIVPKDEKDEKIERLQKEVDMLKERIAHGEHANANTNQPAYAENAEGVSVPKASANTKR